MPLLVFIHGMGMNVKAWTKPAEARILGGKYPLACLLRPDEELETSFGDLRRRGFPVLSWTQSRPAGPIQIAVDELRDIMRAHPERGNEGVVLIGHSRGGLIARKSMEGCDRPVRGLVTLATPHLGTTMARWAVSLSPLASVLNQFVEGVSEREADSAFRRILAFLCGRGLRELLPGSKFFSDLRDKRYPGMRCISVGGTTPDLLKAIPVPLTEIISRLLPDWVIPEEMRAGHGDGLVSAASSVLPYGDEHSNFPVNHAEVLFDKKVRDYVVRSVESMR